MAQRLVFNPVSGKFDVIDVAAAAGTPVFVPTGETFTVPRYKQLLFETVVDCEGVLDLDGILCEVS